MTNLPSGTVAFLMTDIEGSTRLIRDLGAEFSSLLGAHFTLLGDAVRTHGGTLVSSEGDSVFAVFPSVRLAVAAAIEAQQALEAHSWPHGASVRVRMGVHAGEAVLGGRDYTGLEVHRTARMMAAGHGGQILLSGVAQRLAGDLPEGVGLRDLGIYELRDMPSPDRLYQLTGPGLPLTFPPLRTTGGAAPTNLPMPLTRFVGRSIELGMASNLLAEGRLLTLVGPGGTGKTRLAIEVARAGLERHPDGVWFVALDVVRDPALVMAAVATALGVREVPGRTPAALVAEQLAGKRTLLVLDNLEQVIGAAPEIAALLAEAPGTTIIATSRQVLAIAGEHVFAVPPLAMPDEPGRPTAAALAANDCVALFVERARAARAEFALTDANAPAVAAICRRLDGLPLALELAAARISLLSPEQILARMDHRLTLLASSRRDLTDRQRTLRGAIEWSYDLLSDSERTFFRRFGVFSGGADFEAIQAVIDPDLELDADALDVASALVDRSLLRSTQHGDENRLEILETLREYAADRLGTDPDERELTERRHLAFYRALAETSENVLIDPRRDEILDRLDRELPNLRGAIASSISSGELTSGLAIASALRDFWHARNHLMQGRRILEELIVTSAGRETGVLGARAVLTASELASWQGDFATSRRLVEQGRSMAAAAGDLYLLANAEQGLGWSTFGADPAYARGRFEEAIRLAKEIKAEHVLRGAYQGLALALMGLREYSLARAAILEAIVVAESTGDRYRNSMNLNTLGQLDLLGGDRIAAERNFARSLRDARAAGSSIAAALAFDGLATLAMTEGDTERGATLAAAAQRLREELGGAISAALVGREEPLDRARRKMAATDYERAVAAGRALTLDAAVALALGEVGEAAPVRPI